MKLILIFSLIIILGLLQNTGILSFYGVKPNLLLAFLISISFFTHDFLIYLSFILISVILLNFQIGFALEQIIFALLTIVAFFIGRRLHWKHIFNNLLLIGASTILFYLLTSPDFLISNWLTVLLETIYNLIFGLVFFKFFEKWLGHG